MKRNSPIFTLKITYLKLLFMIRHLLKMFLTRHRLNRQLPTHLHFQPILKHLHCYLSGFAGRLTCRACLLQRYHQLMGEAYLCSDCHEHSESTITRERQELLPVFRAFFEQIRQNELPLLQPRGEVRGIAVVLVNDDCDDLAVIGGAAFISFITSWRLLTSRGYRVFPYLVRGPVDPNEYTEKVIRQYGSALGYSSVTHLEIISHGWAGHLLLRLNSFKIKSISAGGSILLNSCCSESDAQRFSDANPKVFVFASDRMTISAEPILQTTQEGPRVRHVIYGSNFITSLIFGDSMRVWIQASPQKNSTPLNLQRA